MDRGPCVWNRSGSCRFAQFNAVAIHRLAMRVRADPRVVAAQMGVALGLSPRIELARSGTHYEQLGTILCRSLRRVLWAGSLHGRHTGWAGATPRLKAVPAQASRPSIRQPEDLAGDKCAEDRVRSEERRVGKECRYRWSP